MCYDVSQVSLALINNKIRLIILHNACQMKIAAEELHVSIHKRK